MEISLATQELYQKVSALIEQARRAAYSSANVTKTLLFWQIGKAINDDILEGERAEYGKQIVSRLATQLQSSYGRSFEHRNLRKMMQFAELFDNLEIVSRLATQLSWSHFVEVLPISTPEARLFYLGEAAAHNTSRDDMREQISRKEFERADIASIQLAG